MNASLTCDSSLSNQVNKALEFIPPLWPLKSFVAVNPFLGFSGTHFLETAAQLRRLGHGEIMMPSSYYLEQIANGNIRENNLTSACKHAEKNLPDPWASEAKPLSLEELKSHLHQSASDRPPQSVQTFAECLDQIQGESTAHFIMEEISKWCSVYYDEGQASWRMPWRDLSLYQGWKNAASLDANPSFNGWNAFNKIVQGLPEEPDKVIALALIRLNVPEGLVQDYLHRSLLSISGWSSYVQYLVREQTMRGAENPSLKELLAIRLAYDLALLDQHKSDASLSLAWEQSLTRALNPDLQLDLLPRYLAHLALETGYQQRLIGKLQNELSNPSATQDRKSLQAVFCIDVRSEIYRRALEAQSVSIETLGFAGFFGMPISYRPFGSEAAVAQCPVLLLPQYEVLESPTNCTSEEEHEAKCQLSQRINRQDSWNAFKTSAITCFSFVETAGLFFGIKLLKSSFAWKKEESRSSKHLAPKLTPTHDLNGSNGSGIPPQDQINLAEGALKGMGLTTNFARLVLICGHGSTTANNPYASGLDCGACGGNAGDSNARVTALILNNPVVREALDQRGITIPDDTHFVAGLHNTTTDEVTIFDQESIPSSFDSSLIELRAWLNGASVVTRKERAPLLGLGDLDDRSTIASNIEMRSRDWAQVRPEWGLANNAAFIVAPRSRTKNLKLHGRTFLHNYTSAQDPEGCILELIMTAPMIVTNWINLQYFASTVNNDHFGSGNKTIHNVVGNLGIWQGNGGDLQVGLPIQSLHNGKEWMHEPLRLSVFIEAPRETIDKVLSKHPAVAALVANQWIHLFSISPKAETIFKSTGTGDWYYLTNPAASLIAERKLSGRAIPFPASS
jgi:uncharacterized protein YbcC (UPF0753/DUF2309 family)